jgi:meiotic recombination protein SPO11
MLMLNVKADIQILDELPGGVASLLSTELGPIEDKAVDAVVDAACSDDGLLF